MTMSLPFLFKFFENGPNMYSAKPEESGKLRDIYIYNAIATFGLFYFTDYIYFFISISAHSAYWDLFRLLISFPTIPNTCIPLQCFTN